MYQSNYSKSNRITTIPLKPDFKLFLLAGKAIESTSTTERQGISSKLVDELSRITNIPNVKIKISETNQYHKKQKGRVVFKQYGYYRKNYIYVQNLTAIRGKPLAGKTFLDTVLHEWLHHYDTHKLKLDSIHTAGFYKRLKDLKVKLQVV